MLGWLLEHPWIEEKHFVDSIIKGLSQVRFRVQERRFKLRPCPCQVIDVAD